MIGSNEGRWCTVSTTEAAQLPRAGVNMDNKHQSNNVESQTLSHNMPGLEGRPNHDIIANGSLVTKGAVEGVAVTALVGLLTGASLGDASDRKDQGSKASAKDTNSLEGVRQAIQAFLQEGDLPLKYNPARELGVFNRVVLQSRTTVEVNSLRGRAIAGVGRFSESGFFASYKVHLDDVVRPDGSYGRVLNEFRSVVIYKVQSKTTPSALKLLPEVLLPISAVVCDEFEGLEIWVKQDRDSWRSFADFQYGVIQAMRSAGIEGIVAEPESYWMIPGSLPEGSSRSKPIRRRLLFACSDPSSFGMDSSHNELSDIWY